MELTSMTTALQGTNEFFLNICVDLKKNCRITFQLHHAKA